MTDETPGSAGEGRPWWHGGAEAMPDVEAIIGPEGMAAVGSAADEALKLFVVLRDRFVTATQSDAGPGPDAGREQAGGESPWGALLGQFAAGAVKAVGEIASAATQQGPRSGSATPSGSGAGPGEAEDAADWPVLPGEAAACSYCPICQAIALFRSVPMTTWQRLAASVVEVADAARDFTGGGQSDHGGPVVVVPQPADDAPPAQSVAEFLRSIQDPPQGPGDAAAQ